MVVILGIIGAIAVPRMSTASSRSRATRVLTDVRIVRDAIDLYRTEHEGLSPAHLAIGLVDSDGSRFERRLTERTNFAGRLTGSTIYGPYLESMPTNIANGLAKVRIDGPPPGAGTHGWRYDTARDVFMPDHLGFDAGRFKADDPSTVGGSLGLGSGG